MDGEKVSSQSNSALVKGCQRKNVCDHTQGRHVNLVSRGVNCFFKQQNIVKMDPVEVC